MDSMFSYKEGKRVIIFGHVFGTPLGLQGAIWLPINELIIWGIFTWLSIRKRPALSGWWHFLFGGVKMIVMLGSEWGHNIAHTAAAHWIGKPVDHLRIILGMPVLVYHYPEDPSITPRQHIIRSLAGSLFNGLLWFLARVGQACTRSGSPVHEVLGVGVGMNAFISCASLLPISAFDGGPILKWSLIGRGKTPAQARQVQVHVTRWLGFGLGAFCLMALRKRRWLISLIFLLLSALALDEGFGNKTI